MFILSLTLLVIIASADQNKSVPGPDTHRGKVVSTMDGGGYTYVEFEENGVKLWAATSQFKVSVGDIIEFSQADIMNNFYSKTLDRTFAAIFFVSNIKSNGSSGAPAMPSTLLKGHSSTHGTQGTQIHGTQGTQIHGAQGSTEIKSTQAITVEPGSVKKAKGGYTVAECYAGKGSLAGKTVRVRGKVVKFSAQIMDTNWIHLQDGTGAKDTNDLTITSKETVKVGDLVIFSGKIVYDKDFGSGYFYPVIIEDAAVVTE